MLVFAAAYLLRNAPPILADKPLVLAFDSIRTPALTQFMTAVTRLGNPVTLGVVTVAASAAAAYQDRLRATAASAGAAFGALLISTGLKSLFALQRPELIREFDPARFDSFPSGHALGATAVFLATANTLSTIDWLGSRSALVGAYALAVGVGLSRVYLGMHWPSDVLAGW
ncbi:MAG: phosphatase PAP2 family protein, partial [Bradymonadaceae bacterium]